MVMGQRLAPVLAIAYMSRIEKPLLDRRPILYCRYIDEGFVVFSTEEEMDTCYELLNKQAENIKFTREEARDNWLPFLIMQVRLEGGFYRTKWYRKPSNKNILVHLNPAHPFKTKRATKSNMFKTAILVSSGRQEEADSLELARKIALSNGYPLALKNSYGAHKKEQHGLNIYSSDRVAFCIPYISDAISSEIRAALHKCGLTDMVRAVEIPPENLKRRLVRNRCYDLICLTPNCVVCPNGQGGDCMTSGAVYLITCNLYHIIVNRKFCLTDVAVVPKFYTGSDHRLLRAGFHFSLRGERTAKFGKRSPKNVLNWDHFASLARLWEDSVSGNTRLWEDSVSGNIDEEYDRPVEHLQDSARNSVKKRLSLKTLELVHSIESRELQAITS
ncbi:hypothetical protein V3C99_017826 [Haemonchus contortus]